MFGYLYTMIINRTKYKANVFGVRDYPYQVIKPSTNKKLGKWVSKGRHTGRRIYTVTLEERATCPKSCVHWYDCYGNTMPFAHRLQYDSHLIKKMDKELAYLNTKPYGILIRLHVLGDFPDIKYVEQWVKWLDKYPNIACYGYTAHSPKESIGDRIAQMNRDNWDRWSVRFSNYPRYKLSANSDKISKNGIICPEQAGQTSSCGSCGLCWNKTSKPILFMTHSYDLRKGKSNANSKQ